MHLACSVVKGAAELARAFLFGKEKLARTGKCDANMGSCESRRPGRLTRQSADSEFAARAGVVKLEESRQALVDQPSY